MSGLVVWMADRRVGVLARKPNGNLRFRYDEAYDGPPVSQALPVQLEAHPHRETRAVFGGLLPEEDVRTALAETLGVTRTNDFRLLEEVGGDVAGALTLLPEGTEPPDAPASRPLDEAALDRILRDLPQRPLAADPDDGIRLSLAGAQPKVPVIVDDAGRLALPTNAAAPTTHILKPEPARFPGLVHNEAFCMDLARACEIAVAPVRKAVSASGLRYLVVERYDRDLTSDPIRRLHQEDLCQALARPSDAKYQADGGPTVTECVDLIRRCTAVPAQEIPRFVRALAFVWIVGNCDAHGKNFSLLYDRGAPTLAPLYDLVSTTAYPQLTKRLAMSLGDARTIDEVGDDAWRALAKKARLRPAFVLRTVHALAERAAVEAERLLESPAHASDVAQGIASRVRTVAATAGRV
jgi:serine/threonine-protein kinase HipA